MSISSHDEYDPYFDIPTLWMSNSLRVPRSEGQSGSPAILTTDMDNSLTPQHRDASIMIT